MTMEITLHEDPARQSDLPPSQQVTRPEGPLAPVFAQEEATETRGPEVPAADEGDLLWTPTQGQDATRSLFPLHPDSAERR